MTKEELILKEDYDYDEIKGIWSKHYKRFLEGSVNKKGYVQVGLKCTDGKYRLFMYHRAVWFLTYGTIPEGYEINHISEVKTDNRLSNLECISHLENIRYGTGIERSAAKRRGIPRPDVSEKFKGVPKTEEHKAKLKNNPLKSKPVVAVDMDGNVVYEFASTAEAERNGFYSSNVSSCCRNCFHRQGNRYYKGYYWYFKEEWEKLIYEQRETNCIAERNR